MTARKKSKISGGPDWFRNYFWFAAAEAIGAIGLVFVAPSEGGSAFALGLSLTRWLLVAGLLALGIAFWVLARRDLLGNTARTRIESALGNPITYAATIAVGLLLSVICFYLILLTFKFTDELIQARLIRLLPVFAWLFLFSIQSLIALPRLKRREEIEFAPRDIWRPFLAALVAFLVVGTLMFLSGFGLHPDRTGWDNPGVPLMATQVLASWLLGVLLYGFLGFIEKRWGWSVRSIDLLAVVALWAVAMWLWIAQPLSPTFFSPAPRAPNFEYYPYSDATTHDLAAQNLLIGDGFTTFIEKPLYSFFLVILHVLVGQNYQSIVTAQIVVLALFPSVLYVLASRLHHRLTGALLAFVVILREANAIALSGEVGVSHSKLLMTDLPTALAISALALLVLRWLQSDHRDLRWPLWVGGSLGLLMLLRSQTIIFLPFLTIIAFWRAGKVWTTRLVYAGLLLLAFALTAVPWMIRNYQNTGQFGYSQPLQAFYLAKQYSLTPENADPGFPENTPVDKYVSLGFARVAQFTAAYPGEVARFITTHFFHNITSSFLALPVRFDLADKVVTFYNLRPYWVGLEDRLWSECCSLDSYIASTPYWDQWDGVLPTEAWLPLLTNIGLVSIGVAAVWKKVRWLAFVPIGAFLFYNISTAIARVSGWRLILPVDWVLILFYCAGIAQIAIWIWQYMFGTIAQQIERHTSRKPAVWQKQALPLWAAVFLGLGLLLPLAELVIPAQYPEISVAEAAQIWERSDLAAQTGLDLTTFLEQPGADFRWGRALYPRFYTSGTGEPGQGISAYNILPFSRMAFWVIGAVDDQVALPLGSSTELPNAGEVFVIGCSEDGYFRAAALVFPQNEAPDVLAGDANQFMCS